MSANPIVDVINLLLQSSKGPEDYQQARYGAGLPTQGRIMPLAADDSAESFEETAINAEEMVPSPPHYSPIRGLYPRNMPRMEEMREEQYYDPRFTPSIGDPDAENDVPPYITQRIIPQLMQLASTQPVQDVIRMMMEMYPDMTDPRGNAEPGSGRPGTTGASRSVTPFADPDPDVADPNAPTRAEIDAITQSVMREKMMKREMREGRFSDPPLPLQGLTPDILRSFEDRPTGTKSPLDNPMYHRYLEPGTPDPIGQMIPQIIQQLASLTQTEGMPDTGSKLAPHNINPRGGDDAALELDEAAKEILDFTPQYPPQVGPQIEQQGSRFAPGLLTRLASLTDPYRSSMSALVPDKVLGDTDEDVETNIPRAAQGMMRVEPSRSRPTVLTPELMRMISDQYERHPDANPLNNPELNEYLEEDTEEPIG